MRTSALRFAIVCGLLACTGCLVVPIPGLGTGPVTRIVDAHTVKFIEPGKTIREDVLLRLGSPESATPAEDQFVYKSEYPTGYRLFVMPLFCSGYFMLTAICQEPFLKTYDTGRQRIRVEITFDADSRVRSVSVREEHVDIRPGARPPDAK